MKTSIRLFDSARNDRVDLTPIEPGTVTLYYCGPTVYNYVHLGNVRPVIVFDVLIRALQASGLKVKAVSNYTDIDDKIIAEAQREGRSEQELSAYYIKAYEDCLAPLHLVPLYAHPKASETIGAMEDFIAKLLDNGFAYRAGNDVFFAVDKVSDYGAISHVKPDENQAGKRIAINEVKHDLRDFALWKLTDDEGIKFDSPFGRGRPGWHTECVTMIKTVFHQPVIDIHGGGFDLKFPHHENERAQSIGYDGTPLANIWMHVGFLTAAKGEKMSKSLGNVVLAKDLLAKHSGNALRLFFYSTHYRSPIAYSDEAIGQAEETATRYIGALHRLQARIQLLDAPYDSETYDQDAFNEALGYLCDDLNIANAVTVLEREVRKALTLLRNPRVTSDQLVASAATLTKLFDLLGIYCEPLTVTAEDRQLYADYQAARAKKDFAASDQLRQALMEKGIL